MINITCWFATSKFNMRLLPLWWIPPTFDNDDMSLKLKALWSWFRFVLWMIFNCSCHIQPGQFDLKVDKLTDFISLRCHIVGNKMELLQSQAPVDREFSGSSASARHGTFYIRHQTLDRGHRNLGILKRSYFQRGQNKAQELIRFGKVW